MYKLYSADYIPCVYCNKLVSLYNSKPHLKTKKCITLQNLLSERERNDFLLKFNREINKTKSELYCEYCNSKPVSVVLTKTLPELEKSKSP